MRKRTGRLSSGPSFYKLILALIIMLCSIIFVYVFKNKLDKIYIKNIDQVEGVKLFKKDVDIGVKYDEKDKKYLDKIIEKITE